MTPMWTMIDPFMRGERLGLIPFFLDDEDPDPAAKQFDKRYQHGGGWRPFRKFKLADDDTLHYPEDPPLQPLAETKLRDERIIFYDCQWMAVIQPDRSFEVSRMD